MASDAVLVIILNYNSASETIGLFQQIGSFGLNNFFVLVVDNASNDLDIELLQNHIPSENLMLNSINLGYAGGNAIGIQKALTSNIPFFLLINPDIRLSHDTLPILLQTIIRDDKIAAVGPRICYRAEPDLIYSDGGVISTEKALNTAHLNFNKKTNDVTGLDMIHPADYINGSVFLARTKIFEDVGFMRSDFFMYFEEAEWCLRAIEKGYRLIVNSQALAYHSSSPKGRKYHYYMSRNRILTSKRDDRLYRRTVSTLLAKISLDVLSALRRGKRPSPLNFFKLKGVIAGILKN